MHQKSKSKTLAGSRKLSLVDADDEVFQALHLRRKLGQAFYNLGNFASANKHLLAAAKMFKISPNTNERVNSAVDDKMLKEFGPLMACDAHMKREIVLSLLTMAKCFYYSCNRKVCIITPLFLLIFCSG